MSARHYKKPQPKNLPLAIGLNFLLPGAGYVYMGRPFIGLVGGISVLTIIYMTGLQGGLIAWLTVNTLMSVDMLTLNSKRAKLIEAATTKKCKWCAELIKKEAIKCRFCGESVDTNLPS
jgi:hypothetical protein